MKTILQRLHTALLANLLLAAICCGAYPLLVWAIAQTAFPHQANGSLILDTTSTVRGSTRIGQPFSGPTYFHPRPSAAGTGIGYDATASGGSNLGPTSRKLHETLRDRIASYRALNQVPPGTRIPADAVTASASGLDPHISPRNAALQVARVAAARDLNTVFVTELVERHTAPPDLDLLGSPRVNVLTLNLALDALHPATPGASATNHP